MLPAGAAVALGRDGCFLEMASGDRIAPPGAGDRQEATLRV